LLQGLLYSNQIKIAIGVAALNTIDNYKNVRRGKY